MKKEASVWEKYKGFVGSVDKNVNFGLGCWGEFVANRPKTIITLAAVVAIGLSAGMVRIGSLIETASDKLWVPQDSIWITQEEYLLPRLGRQDRIVQLIIDRDDGGNILTAESIRYMFDVYDAMAAVSVPEDGESKSWMSGICWKDASGNCRSSGLLDFFSTDRATFESVAAQGQAAILQALSVKDYPSGGSVSRESVFFNYDTDASGNVTSATMALWSSLMSPDVSDDLNIDWGLEVEEVLKPDQPQRPTSDSTNFYFQVPTSIDNAIGESIAGDIPLIAVAVTVICIFCTIALFVADWVHNRASLALVAVISIALSISAAYGLSLIFGIRFTSLSQLLPFILLGIGVDDVFVLVRSVEEVVESEAGLPIPTRFRKALNLGGMSITVTSVTNAAAFLFGSLTAIPAVRWFCWSSAIAIMLVWALQLTLFLGAFVLTERRIDARRMDCCCCISRSAVATTDGEGSAKRPIGLMSAHPDSLLQRAMNKVLLPAITHPLGKVLILAAAVTVGVLGAVGFTRVGEGLPLSSLAPDSHYFKPFQERNDRFTEQAGFPGNVYFRNMDQADPAIQRKMEAAFQKVLDSPTISRELSSSTTWLSAFKDYAAATGAPVDADGYVEQASFYSVFNPFLDAMPHWKDRMYIKDGKLEVSGFSYLHEPNPTLDGAYERRIVSSMHDVGKDVNAEVFSAENEASSEPVAMVESGIYKFIETNNIIFRELLLNLGLALVGVAVIGVILLLHPVAIALMLACIVLVDLILFAEMWLLDIRLNTVSVVNLVMAVGLAVDYSLHVLHTFLSKRGATRQDRVRSAMLEIGAAVLLGVLSTLLGVLVLSGSASTIIRTFFKLLFGTVLFGGLVGLFVLPVLLTLLGPGPCLAKDEEDLQGDIEQDGAKQADSKEDEVV